MRKVPKLRFKEFSDEWKEKRLGDIFERITEKNTENNTNILTISAQYGLISQIDFFNKSVAGKDLSKYYLLKKDDFAYNKSYSNGYPFGAIKKLNKYEKGIVSTLYICFRLKNKNNIVDFFEQFFESKKIDKNIQDIAQEGARNHGLLNINIQDFFDITKYSPSLQEQEKIANFLSNIDKKISLTEEKLELFREYKKGVMQKIFSQELRFKDSNGNDYPEWKEKRLGEICIFINGKGHEQFVKENGKYIIVNSKFISSDGKIKKYTDKLLVPLSKNNILMVMSDVPNGKAIGKCYLVEEDNKYSLNQRICSLETKESSRFIYYYLNRNKYFLKFDDGISQTNLKKEEVLACPILLPSLEEQQKIADFLSSIDSKIESIEKELEGLKEFKRGLLQQMFV